MFYGKGSEEPLFILRKMIMAGSEAERREILEELYPFVKRDMKATLEVMGERPVTFRLLDPPLHEFVPQNEAERKELAEALDITAEVLDRRADELHALRADAACADVDCVADGRAGAAGGSAGGDREEEKDFHPAAYHARSFSA